MKNKEALEALENIKNILKEELNSWDYQEDLEKLINERNNLLDEIDYLKDDIDMLRGANDHLASILDRTNHLYGYTKQENEKLKCENAYLNMKIVELEGKLRALTIGNYNDKR